MNDYISRKAAIAAMHELEQSVSGKACHTLDTDLINEVLGEIPAVDVHPVKFGKLTGEWLEDEYGYCRCSICGYELDDPETTTPYCPICGAKMESEDK